MPVHPMPVLSSSSASAKSELSFGFQYCYNLAKKHGDGPPFAFGLNGSISLESANEEY
jgi:hypothetical protein